MVDLLRAVMLEHFANLHSEKGCLVEDLTDVLRGR